MLTVREDQRCVPFFECIPAGLLKVCFYSGNSLWRSSIGLLRNRDSGSTSRNFQSLEIYLQSPTSSFPFIPTIENP